jgi:hypothetical protein
VTDNDNYQRKIEITTGSDRTIYMGIAADGSAKVSFMYGDSSTYKGFYSYDNDAKEMQFELQALTSEGSLMSFFRIFRDESEEVAETKLVGSYKEKGSSENVRWTLHGNGEDDIAVSMKWAGQTSGSGLDTCVDPSTFAASGTSSTCGDFKAPTVADFGTLMNAFYDSIGDMEISAFEATFGADDVVNFSSDDIQSADAVE